jgi:hypothetical protein
MRWKTYAMVLTCLLLWDRSASADSFIAFGSGSAYDVGGQETADWQISADVNGVGLSIIVGDDNAPTGFVGLVPGQTYSISYTVGSEYFNGLYGGEPITGSGLITWQFNVVAPEGGGDPLSAVTAPATVTGYFSFCPLVNTNESGCGPGDDPLGSAIFTGIGNDDSDFACSPETCSLYTNDVDGIDFVLDVTTVPEPPTLGLMLCALLFYPMLLYIGRPSSRHLRQVKSN